MQHDDTMSLRADLAVGLAIAHLKQARKLLKSAGATKTLARVRLAISSAKGAERNAGYRKHRAQRKAEGA